MNYRCMFALVSFALFFLAVPAHAATTIEEVTLQPGEAKSFSIKADVKTKIGFKPVLEMAEARKCENQCIELSQVGGKSLASMYGGAIGMMPENGKIEVTLKNVEQFPINVELFKK